MKKSKLPILLASASPQRYKLLRQYRVSFKVIQSNYRERRLTSLSPGEVAIRHAIGKVCGVTAKRGLVIGADTGVSFKGRVYGKPRNRRDAKRMLKLFSGKAQDILTGVAIRNLSTGEITTFLEKSTVTFRKMPKEDIEAYLDTGDYKGKAGSFGLQGKGAHLIRSVRGSESNVIGLPVERLVKLLSNLN